MAGSTVTNLRQIFIVSQLIAISFLNLTWHILCTSKNQLFIVKGYALKNYVRCHWHLVLVYCHMFLVWEVWFPKKPVHNQLRRAAKNRPEQLSEHQTKHVTAVPLVVTYDLQFHVLGRIIGIIYLYAEEQVKQILTPASFVSFRSGFSLRNHLV